MQRKETKFEVKLPARITGLVFWGLLLLGLLVSVIILQQVETDLVASNQDESLIISYEIEEIVEVDENFDDTSLNLVEGGEFGVGKSAPATAPGADDNSLVGKWKRLPKQKKIIYGDVGLFLVLMLF